MSEATDKATQVQDVARPADTRRAIEVSFPIVQINRLAIPERNAFKPIYQMHKWFARRASCVFRAILLGALKPAGADIMEEFYRDHTNDLDTNGKVILDPFMGGGTTVVEALRLGCKVIGIDLNPVAWFIVKSEVEPVDLDELGNAFERLANRKTSSGRTVREELLSHYKTQCPACGNSEADIMYVFWVRSAICTNPEHVNEQVPLFPDYLVAEKKPSIRYFPDARCPHNSCGRTFDWEIEPASLVGDPRLMIASGLDGAGEGRGNRRWAYSLAGEATKCPWCSENIVPETRTGKPQRKKAWLSVLYCPHCATIFQYRGTPPDDVECPGCSKSFAWQKGNVPESGDFQCPKGHRDAILESIRRLPSSQLLPTRMYGIEGYCPRCDREAEEEEDGQKVLVGSVANARLKATLKRQSLLWKNNGRFFKAVSPADERKFQEAKLRWEQEKSDLPYPKQEIPDGQETHRLVDHHYRYWHQMFNPRQLLCLSTLLKAIGEEEQETLKDMMLTALFNNLNNVSDFCSYRVGVRALRQVFARHDFQLKNTPCENNVWGTKYGMGTFSTWIEIVSEGKAFLRKSWDYGDETSVFSDNVRGMPTLSSSSSTSLADFEPIDFVITDPPYGGNVNYSELADYFYVWLRLMLAERYPAFAPELTPKGDECVENPSRGKTASDFEVCLTKVFSQCRRVLKDNGLLIFTFHHSEGKTWESLLNAICESGWEVLAVYPVQAESEAAMPILSGTTGITYDLIHVCRKRDSGATRETRAWATVKREIRSEARKEIERIEQDVYGSNRSLSPADKLIILTGKCLQLYSRHYNAVVDHEKKVVRLHEALEDIRMLVDQMVSKERPLPTELEDIDRPSYVYLTALSEKKEIKSDEVHKATRGIIEIKELLDTGLMKKGRAGRGRTFEVKTPGERFTTLLDKFKDQPTPQPGLFANSNGVPEAGQTLFIDRLHFLMGLAEGGENLRPWIERWRGEIPQIRAATEYLMRLRKDFAPALKRIQAMIEVRPLRFE